ncbi:hypothetical protein [Actinospica robiniae]|uniref:hypothetical protein n=1 Tax=Actinospica robiniae TaxID=304901 RepID=UPI0003FD8A0E|nr:hypothetical protein [Actinospica robiniae]
MLTLNHVAEEQAAILAACPRPRALAPSLVDWSVLPATSVSAVSAGLGSVAAVRPAADERPQVGYAWRSEMAGFGLFAATLAGAGILGTVDERGSKTQDQQDKKQSHLTHGREPRTWRPPH